MANAARCIKNIMYAYQVILSATPPKALRTSFTFYAGTINAF